MREAVKTSLGLALLALTAAPAMAKDVINYQDHIRPIFQQSCFNCHNADKARGGLDLTSYRATVAGGSSGDIVVSQSAGESSLFGVMNHTLEPKMPPNGGKVADDKLKLVKLWIDQGLRETADSAINKPKKPRVDLSVGKAAVGRPDGPAIMPADMPLGPINHTTKPGAVSAVAGHPWSPIVASTGQQQVLIHHADTGELLGVLPFAFGQPQTLRFSWTGRLLMVGGGVGGSSGTVVLYDVQTGEQVTRVGDEVDEVLAADLDPTQRFVALGGPSKRVKGYDVATGELRYNLDKHTEWVTAIAFSPDGDYLASGDRNGGLHIWEADSGLHVYRLDGHGDSVTALSWRYDGKVLASSGEDGQARLWEMKNGKQVKNWGAHSGGAMSIAYAEDGRLVTTGRDQFIRVWDANGGKKFETKSLESIGLSAAFDTSSNAVVAGDLTGKLVRWSLKEKAQQVDAWSSNPPPIAVAVSQSAEHVAAQQAVLDQIRTAAKQEQAKLLQAQQATADLDAALNALRASVKAGEQTMPKQDRARKEANSRLEQAARELRDARGADRQASNTLKAKQGESNRIKRDHDRAVSDLNKAKQELERATNQAIAAEAKVKEQPEDAGLKKRAGDLAKKVTQAEQKVTQRQAIAEQRAEQLAAAEKKEDQAKSQRQAMALKVDQAEQMEQARKQERDEANKLHDQTRKTYFEEKGQIRPAEDKLKQSQAAEVKAKAVADEAASKVVTAKEVLAKAKRSAAKWQSAELRLKIDVIKKKRDALRGEKQLLIAQRDQKLAEVNELVEQLASIQQQRADQANKLQKQSAAITKAKQHVEVVKKQVEPAKPKTAEALEDAQFDLETEVYALKKLNEVIAEQAKAVPVIQAKIDQARKQLTQIERAITKFAKDPGAKQDAEVVELLPRYEALRKAAGF
ncbi:MAG: c-type cytochrome domain-containing protein [Phycisphaeraceae bacterium]